jgi:hypothetical protein
LSPQQLLFNHLRTSLASTPTTATSVQECNASDGDDEWNYKDPIRRQKPTDRLEMKLQRMHPLVMWGASCIIQKSIGNNL